LFTSCVLTTFIKDDNVVDDDDDDDDNDDNDRADEIKLTLLSQDFLSKISGLMYRIVPLETLPIHPAPVVCHSQ